MAGCISQTRSTSKLSKANLGHLDTMDSTYHRSIHAYSGCVEFLSAILYRRVRTGLLQSDAGAPGARSHDRRIDQLVRCARADRRWNGFSMAVDCRWQSE